MCSRIAGYGPDCAVCNSLSRGSCVRAYICSGDMLFVALVVLL